MSLGDKGQTAAYFRNTRMIYEKKSIEIINMKNQNTKVNSIIVRKNEFTRK